MSAESSSFRGGSRPGKSLAARGGAMQTFAGLALFAALSLLLLGAYIIAEEVANPMGAGSLGIVGAAFLLSMALILAGYLLPLSRDLGGHSRTTVAKRPLSSPGAPGVVRRSISIQEAHQRTDLPYQRYYVDPVSLRVEVAQARGIAAK